MATARVTSKGRITVPLEVRRFLSIRKRERIMFRQDGDRVYVERVPADVPSSLVFGRLHRPGMEPLDIETARVKARAMRARCPRRPPLRQHKLHQGIAPRMVHAKRALKAACAQ